MVAILENHQQADGSVVVPEALRPYLGSRCSPPSADGGASTGRGSPGAWTCLRWCECRPASRPYRPGSGPSSVPTTPGSGPARRCERQDVLLAATIAVVGLASPELVRGVGALDRVGYPWALQSLAVVTGSALLVGRSRWAAGRGAALPALAAADPGPALGAPGVVRTAVRRPCPRRFTRQPHQAWRSVGCSSMTTWNFSAIGSSSIP